MCICECVSVCICVSCEDGCVVVIANVCRKLKLCASLKYYNSVVGLFFFSSDRMLSVQLLMENFRPQQDQSFVYTYKIHWTQSMVSREITRHTSRQIGQCGRNLRHQNHSNRKGGWGVLCSCQVSGVRTNRPCCPCLVLLCYREIVKNVPLKYFF